MNQVTAGHPPLEIPQECTVRTELCALASVRRVAAMLDLNPDDFDEGGYLPRGWQFILMGADTKRTLLRADGFPGLGVPMPDLGLPRLLLGSRSVSYSTDIPIGASVVRKSRIQSLTSKSTKSGPMAVVTIEHELGLRAATNPALVETQTYLLLPANRGAVPLPTQVLPASDYIKTVVPDETMLFQYSALGFNSHKIHIDRGHARNVEGFPDLVVNGGLTTLLLTEFLRSEVGVKPSSINVRHLAPLYCGSPITMTATKFGLKWQMQAFDSRSTLTVDMEVHTHGL